MMLILALLSIATTAFAGTICPQRESIYPCSCLSLPQGKKIFFTSVTCHRLRSTDDLMNIFPSLKAMNIDHFYLYDSFWEANKLETSEGENKQVLPTDWITLLKIKEIEIVDTTLSACFACNLKLTTCRNAITTRFTATNSSSHDKICHICNVGNTRISWTACLTTLRQFHFTYSQMTTVRPDLFPSDMRELTEIDLSHNQIAKVEAKSFYKTPRLKVLNLSHNALQSLDAMFSGQKMLALEELDVSWNSIKTLGADVFPNVPALKVLRAENNFIVDLLESEWKNVGNNLRIIDLKDNPLHCDCNIRWVNTTFHINVDIQGHCATPEDYQNSLIRKASRMLNERCDEDGNIGTRLNKKTTPSL